MGYLYKTEPPIENLRVFGTLGYSHVSREVRRNLDDTAVRVRFLGYSEDRLGYIVQNLTTRRIFYSRTFYCDEEAFLQQDSKLVGNTGERIEFDASRYQLKKTEASDFDDVCLPASPDLFPTNDEKTNKFKMEETQPYGLHQSKQYIDEEDNNNINVEVYGSQNEQVMEPATERPGV